MGPPIVWRTVIPDCSVVEVEDFLDIQKSHKTYKSQPETSQVCNANRDRHKMRYVVYECASTSCARVAQGDQCQWRVKNLTCYHTQRCAVYEVGHHITNELSPWRHKLTNKMKRIMRDKTEQGVKPSRILNTLIDTLRLETVEGLLKRVQRLASYYEKTKMNDSNDIRSMAELIVRTRFCAETEETTTFTFGFKTNDFDEPSINNGSEEQPLVIGLSTKRLIRRLGYASTHVLHADATYKLNTCGFPVFVIGVSDVKRQFHLVALFLTSDMKQPQIESMLRSIFELYQAVEVISLYSNTSCQMQTKLSAMRLRLLSASNSDKVINRRTSCASSMS